MKLMQHDRGEKGTEFRKCGLVCVECKVNAGEPICYLNSYMLYAMTRKEDKVLNV